MNIPVIFILKNPSSCLREIVNFFFSLFSSGSHVVQRSRTTLAILVEGHPRNIPVKLFQNPFTGVGEVI